MQTLPSRHPRLIWTCSLLLPLVLASPLAGCNIQDPHAGDEILFGESCAQDGERVGNLECVDGRYVSANNSTPLPSDMGEPEDQGTNNTTSPTDMGGPGNNTSTCTPENIANFCVANMAQCGELTAVDKCGNMRTEDCGTCREGQCLADNSCSICQPETDEQFCVRFGASCSEVMGFDLCGDLRTVESCGECESPLSCDQFSRQCRCINEPDATFCQRLGAECGSLTDTDNCGDRRTVDCGGCSPGTCRADNTCSECQAETNAELCQAAAGMGKTPCGALVVDDSCNNTRDIACGTCETGETCTANACDCPVPACGDKCGLVFNDCGNSIDCGGCPGGETCNTMTNQCPTACMPETDAVFCQRYSVECGSYTQQDNCGDMRTVTDCGACPNGQSCAMGQCQG